MNDDYDNPERFSTEPEPVPAATVMDMVFLGFNSRVIALHRDSGELLWQWKSPKGRDGYVAVLLDGDRVIASVQGYTYCLDAVTGMLMWENQLKGTGLGSPSVVSMRGNSGSAGAAAIIARQKAAAAAAAGA
jgi:outer membrane protein assembly factor BamB